MDFKHEIRNKLLIRGFTKSKQLNNRGLIGATIDETILILVKKLAVQDLKNYMDLKHELEVTDKLLIDLQRVLDAIPECTAHGKCIPHAIDWIEEMKTIQNNKNELLPNTRRVFRKPS